MRHLFLLFALLSTGSLQAQQGQLLQKYVIRQFEKESAPNTGPAPDYRDLRFWAASPHKTDPSDSVPAFLKKETPNLRADVFFIHPTSYLGDASEMDLLNGGNRREAFEALKTEPWNADLTDTAVNNRTDARAIRYQASVFNGSCRVFAPRYRQANLKAFFIRDSPASQRAFDLAYADIKAAFEHYLKNENQGRPILIASHSQGTLHAIRLLQEFFDDKPLQNQLVCAYLIGYQLPKNTFKRLPVGTSPTMTGCFVGWRTYQKDVMPPAVAREEGNSVCVNPLTWTTDTKWADKSQNRGSLIGFNTLIPQAIGAGIEPASRILWVTLPEKAGARLQNLKNLHTFDYNLFWMNIRENVRARVEAFGAAERK
ncbi:DUF3089 domain-containing protein [Tellurirhabdus rosea]|uniref:DUF3089 domain-containing protein n=1 Tax=Tellurirhabdus rosea TaxID=2674997 RepID=UPI00225223F5|nr:DUF3089 domain-containing protein [Tellurirhabdus rosea]